MGAAANIRTAQRMLPFRDRAEAGHRLALEVSRYVDPADCIVLALPRGGVPVAFEIAKHLGSPLDLLFVRKVGLPWQPELAIAAVASGGVTVVDRELADSLHISGYFVQELISKKQKELETRESAFRACHPAIPLKNRSVVLVDDGVATGWSMLAAIGLVRDQKARELTVAVPVASQEAAQQFRRVADKFVCLECPEPFIAVSQWYEFFPQVSDKAVEQLLTECSRSETSAMAAAGSG